MRFAVLSRSKAEKYQGSEPYIMISITDPDKKRARFRPDDNRIQVIRRSFHDVEATDKFSLDHYAYQVIDKSDARAIIESVKVFAGEIDLIVVHCEAGVSRSAGVAAALARIYNGRDDCIFGDPAFCPNMTVYRMILNEWFGTGSAFGEIES